MPNDDPYAEFRDTGTDNIDPPGPKLRLHVQSLLHRTTVPKLVEIRDKKTGEWRTVVRMSREKFDDERKGIFLREYSKFARMGEACAAAGVTSGLVRKHLDQDEDFQEAFLIANQHYQDKLIRHHQDLVFNGTEKIIYDRVGNIVSTETIYPQRLIELELKANDHRYRDKIEATVTHKGGVMVVPATMDSVDDWENKFSALIDVTPKEDEEEDRD